MPAPVAPGVLEEQQLQKAGFSPDEIAQHRTQKAGELMQAGFSAQEISDYYGSGEPDMSATKNFISDNLTKLKSDQAANPVTADASAPPSSTHEAHSFIEAMESGLQMSTAGVIARGKLSPDITTPEHADWTLGIASKVGQFLGDVPAMAAGMVAGGSAGATAGATIGAAGGIGGIIAGAGVGGSFGATSGAFAFPAALRKILVDHYQKGDIKDFPDFWTRASATFLEALKGGVVGAATEGAGGVVGGAVGKTALPVIAKAAAPTMAEIATMATMGKAVEGQVPNSRDFTDAAVMVLGMHALGHIVGSAAETIKQGAIADHVDSVEQKLHDVYVKTGKTPEQVAEDARNDPALYQQLLSKNNEIPDAYKAQMDPDLAKAGISPEPAAKELNTADRNSALSEGYVPEPKIADTPKEENPLDKVSAGTGGGAEEIHPIDKKIVSSDSGKNYMSSNFDRFYTATLDDLNPMKKLVDLMTDGQKLKALEDPYVLSRLTRGNYGRLTQVLENGPYKFDTLEQTGTPGLKDILKPVKDDLQGFRRYAVSMRAVELNARGIETGIPIEGPEGAKTVIKAGEEKFGEPFKQLVQFQNDMLGYLKDSGILSQKSHDQMLEANKSYVPFFRLMDEGASGKRGAGKGMVVFNPAKKIEGSSRPIVDPIESVIRNTGLYIQLAERNRALNALADLADKTGTNDLVQKVGARPETAAPADAEKLMEQHGMKDNAELASSLDSEKQPLAKGEIAVFRDGRREIYKVPEEVAKAVNGMDSASTNMFIKILSKPAKVLRAGSVLAPEFGVRNVFRDQATAFVLSKSGYVPGLDAVMGLGSLMKNDENYQNWLKGGGANSAMAVLDRDYINEKIFNLSKETGLLDTAQNVVRHPLQILHVLSEFGENATRLGEFRKASKGGGSAENIFSGAYNAREVTLDFARMGAQTRALNQIIAFWNANVQGVDRLAREFKERPVPTLAKAVASITIPSMLLWSANKDDPRWAGIPDWQKNMFYIAMTKDTIYRIPKDHEAGLMFGSLPERVLEAYFADNPKAWNGFASTTLGTFTPGLLPNALTPFMEQFANRSFFRGNSIIPARLEGLLPQEQYSPYTSETAKAIGKVIGKLPAIGDDLNHATGGIASPAIIDNYLTSWTGTLGSYALKLSDYALTKAGIVPPRPKPQDTLADMPFLKAFVIRYPSENDQRIEDFYQRYARNATVIKTLDYLRSNIQSQSSAYNYLDILMQHGIGEQEMLRLDFVPKGLSMWAKTARNIADNPNMSPADKRQIIDKAIFTMINFATVGNTILDKIDKNASSLKPVLEKQMETMKKASFGQ